MDDIKRNLAQRQREAELMDEMHEIEAWLHNFVLLRDNMPLAWHDIAREKDLPKKKVPLTIRLDPDVVKFFREQGRGYQARMNQVLRAYMLGVLSRTILTGKDFDATGNVL